MKPKPGGMINALAALPRHWRARWHCGFGAEGGSAF